MTGGMNAMILHWMMLVWNNSGNSAICLPLLLIASIALICINDWNLNVQARDKETCIRELEALFALEDCRERRGIRPWGQR
jgi:hypothetical protein